MAIKVFADGANLEGMLDMYENGNVQGFTTNPSLMKKGGVTDYRAFAKEVLAHITDVSVSFEVFADDVETMEVEAREIATWAENVYVKIPCVTTKGESTAELVRKLSADGIKVNVTTIFTPEQVDEMVEAVDAETPSIISLFAGRIADTGVDPIPFMTESVKKAAAKPNCEVLWASTRELINIYQAEACGCQIITVPNSILAKRKNIGRDPYEVSLDTVRGFAKPDIARAIMEGTVSLLAEKLGGLREKGIAARSAVMVGGPSESPLWTRVIEEMTGLSVRVMDGPGTFAGALGAAMMAGIAAGLYRDEAEAFAALRSNQGGKADVSAAYDRV